MIGFFAVMWRLSIPKRRGDGRRRGLSGGPRPYIQLSNTHVLDG